MLGCFYLVYKHTIKLNQISWALVTIIAKSAFETFQHIQKIGNTVTALEIPLFW